MNSRAVTRLGARRTRTPAPRVSLARSVAVVTDGVRQCAMCGCEIDPKDWCHGCRKLGKPCAADGGAHKSLTKRQDAAFCGDDCRKRNRSTYIRDCT